MALPENGPRQLPLEFVHEPSHAEDDYLVGAGNALAYARIEAWPHWPDGVTMLIGPTSSGKSHVARIFAERSGALLVTPETIAAVASAHGNEPLVLEDVDRLDYNEDDLFHLLNQAMRGDRTLLLTAREVVAKWDLRTDDVRSRIRRAPVFTLEISDDIALSQIFVKLFGDRQITVDPKIIGYVVPRMERSPEEAERLVDLMDKLALAKGSAITRAIAGEALAVRQDADSALKLDWDADDDE